MGYTEASIIGHLKAGDNKIFEWLFLEYYSPLCIYAHRFVGDAELSKEIVASTFAVIWERREDIVFGKSVKAYIFRMVHNKCVDHLRQRTVRKRYEQYLLDRLADGGLEMRAEEVLPTGDLLQAIERAIGELPEKCREIFLLSRLGNKKYHEIAGLLDVSVKTVETQMSIALRKLRHSLRHWIPLFIFFLFRG